MNFEDLTEDNFLMYVMKYYENPQCLQLKDFYDDLKIFKYIKRLINRYQITDDLKDRLILNHIIMLGNVFPVNVLARSLFFKMPEKTYPILKTFLIYLNYMPDVIDKVNGKYIYSADIPVDLKITKILREI